MNFETNKKIQIYCSGTCHNNGKPEAVGSWGAVLKLGDYYKEFKSILYDDFVTNQRAELYACIESLKQVKSDDYLIVVHSDSQYVVDCFKECWYRKWEQNGWKTSDRKPIANKDLWYELLGIWVFHDVEFEYLPDSDPSMKRAHELAEYVLKE